MPRLKLKDTISDRWKSICTHEYEILDEIRESSISDDEEPGDWAGYSLMRVVSVVGAARGIAQMVTSASGHQLERLHRPLALVGAQVERSPAVSKFSHSRMNSGTRGGSEYKTYRN